MPKLYVHVMAPIRPLVSALMLSLRRRWLERQLAQEFDVELSRQLDAVIQEEEEILICSTFGACATLIGGWC